jgi:5-methylcytosine-specific restriction endonuclease McrA
MPIDYRNYPKGWLTEIRPRILARDGHCCKFCGLADRVRGWWVPSGKFYTAEQFAEDYFPVEEEDELIKKMERKPNGSLVVLTIAHLDHGLTNHDDDNLAALCQRCHLNYDRAATATQRRQSRRYGGRKQQLPLDFLHLPSTAISVRPTTTHRTRRRPGRA